MTAKALPAFKDKVIQKITFTLYAFRQFPRSLRVVKASKKLLKPVNLVHIAFCSGVDLIHEFHKLWRKGIGFAVGFFYVIGMGKIVLIAAVFNSVCI